MMDTQAKQNFTIEATVIRANGTTENLGTIVGGTLLQKAVAFIRIKFINFKHQWQQYSQTPGGRR